MASRNVRDIAWLAGLLEGEGCFSWGGDCADIALRMTDRDVVDRAHSMMGATQRIVQQQRPGQGSIVSRLPDYTFRVSGLRAIAWMMTLYPLMGERRRLRIRGVLGQWKLRGVKNAWKTHCKRGHPLSGGNVVHRKGKRQRNCRQCRLDGYQENKTILNARRRDRRRAAA
jgi:hypothetical protein